jgi:hypothetical protein
MKIVRANQAGVDAACGWRLDGTFGIAAGALSWDYYRGLAFFSNGRYYSGRILDLNQVRVRCG